MVNDDGLWWWFFWWLIIIWLVVYLPLWKIWKSVGMIIPNIWKKKCSKPPTSNVWYVQTSPNQKKLSGWYLKFKTFKRKKAQLGMIPMTIMCSHPSAGLQAAPGLPLVSQHSGCQGLEKTGVETGWKSLILPWILPCFVEFACFTWIASPQKVCCIWSHEMPMARPVTGIQAPFPTCGTEWIRRCWRFFGHLPVSRSYDRLQHVIRDNSGESHKQIPILGGWRGSFSVVCVSSDRRWRLSWCSIWAKQWSERTEMNQRSNGCIATLKYIVFSWAYINWDHIPRNVLIWQCVKTLYPCSSHQNSWVKMNVHPIKNGTIIGIDP